MKRFLLTLTGLVLSLGLFAQTGEIQGKVVDPANGEGLPFATVTVVVNGNLVGAQTDFDGFYSIKPVPPGSYTVTAKYLGYQTTVTEGVLVSPDKITFADLEMAEESTVLDEIVVKSYKVPLIKPDETSTGGTMTKEDIENLPTRNVQSIASTTAGVYQADEGAGLNVKGARESSTEYYIDGIKVSGSTALPASAIEQLNVVTGGVPARYGDATGGIINITTRGPSNKFAGGLEAVTSQFLDPYGYNLITGSLSGPIAYAKKGTEAERPVLGFFFAGEFLTEKDDDPSALGIFQLKEDKLNEITQSPLVIAPQGQGLLPAVEFLTAEDFETVDTRSNVEKTEINATGKIDFQPVPNLNFTIGGNYHHRDGGLLALSNSFKNFVRRYEPFANNHIPIRTEDDYRGFVRFTQRFGGRQAATTEGEETTASALQNAYYSIQFDYSRSLRNISDPIHKGNLFDYGYIGRFTQDREEQYIQQDVDVGTANGTPVTVNARVFQGFAGTGVGYEPAVGLNPEAVAWNNQFFDLVEESGGVIPTINFIPGFRGLLNGNRFLTSYNLYYAPGQNYNYYRDNENDQYRLTFNGSVDIKKPNASERNKHALEFGLEYEQRVSREYEVEAPDLLWDRMRQLVSQIGPSGEIQRDLDNPFVLLNGSPVSIFDWDENENGPISPFDTIVYNFQRVEEGTYFDRMMRAKFGLGDLDFINPDAYGPQDYSLDMFSPDDLFGGGNRDNIVRYFGYDYLGNKLDNQPAFKDFWTEIDETTGVYSRPMGAFRPIYTSAFVQDKFNFKDIIFRVGVRVDRFDANQKVLKDPFSLYGVRTASEVLSIGGSDVSHPATIGDDYVVYVDNEVSPGSIKGYRDGLDWYDSNGRLVSDPKILAESGNVLPYLSNPLSANPQNDIKNPLFDTDTAFEDYDPQITLMPRVSFSFPISDEALFFAHYDVLTQRPQGRIVGTPHDYYFFSERVIDNVLNNPNLRPEKTVDYQFGFQQKLSNSSALKLAAFYRELRDMVQVVNLAFAYPVTYRSYGNVDFGTVKGFEATYDLRRTKNLRMLASYTLQFADGTGSGDRSQINLINNGEPNLRSIQALDFDARHLVSMQLDYRFGSGKNYTGPKIGERNILSELGFNATIRARSGTPYSGQRAPGPSAQFGVANRTSLEGQINGSRLPWNFDTDLRVDKSFYVGESDLRLNVYLSIQNLFDTRNVINVYSFTGSPVDDGYLSSGVGIEDAEGRADEDAFIYQYGVKVANPNNYSMPRTIRLGASVSF